MPAFTPHPHSPATDLHCTSAGTYFPFCLVYEAELWLITIHTKIKCHVHACFSDLGSCFLCLKGYIGMDSACLETKRR